MVLESITNTANIEKLHPSFAKAFNYIKSQDFISMEPCKIELDDKNLFIIVSESTGKDIDEVKMETHNKYIDIQIPIIGTETMGWIAKNNLKNELSPYNPDKDITFYTDKPAAYIVVNSGDFAIFFPEDGHAPGIGEGVIKKIIVKVAI
jgi:YhcH/YjgK/YiaL family protein